MVDDINKSTLKTCEKNVPQKRKKQKQVHLSQDRHILMKKRCQLNKSNKSDVIKYDLFAWTTFHRKKLI